MSVQLFVGGQGCSINGEPTALEGYRMFSAAHHCFRYGFDPTATVIGLLDSGAFTDAPSQRLTPEGALERQLRWEGKACHLWGFPWQATGLVSYDLLIDETWIGDVRVKRRWSVAQADQAVTETVEAARYLASQREQLAPRKLILAAQGVDAWQYGECVDELLKVAHPSDWIGLGGWCILGQRTTLLPTFWQTIRLVLPRIAAAGVVHVHLFGVLYQPALGGLLWLADQHGLSVSTDSSAPILACAFHKQKRRAARRPYWRDNVAWWQAALASLRQSQYYRPPPDRVVARQDRMEFGSEVAACP
jgi:hypothetical protein